MVKRSTYNPTGSTFMKVPHRSLDGVTGNSGKKSYMGREYRGTVYPMKKDDPTHLKPKIKGDLKVEFFTTDDNESMQKLQQVYQMALENKVTIGYEERNYNQSKGRYDILIKYAEVYYTAPEGIHN